MPLLHHSVQYRRISPELDSSDPYMEGMGAAVRCATAMLDVFIVYIPPLNSCASRYMPKISSLMVGNNRLAIAMTIMNYDMGHGDG